VIIKIINLSVPQKDSKRVAVQLGDRNRRVKQLDGK